MIKPRIVTELNKREIKGIDAVQQAMRNMYAPNQADLKRRAQDELTNLNFTEEDVDKYFDIFGSELGGWSVQ